MGRNVRKKDEEGSDVNEFRERRISFENKKFLRIDGKKMSRQEDKKQGR